MPTLKNVSILVLMEDVKEQKVKIHLLKKKKKVSILVLMEDVKEQSVFTFESYGSF